MAIYVELLRFELRKIFRGRIAIPALVVSAGMLLGIALINYLVVSPYDRSVYEREVALEGRALDDALLAELAEEAEKAGGLSGIGPDSPYYHLAGYISRMQGTYLTVGEGLESEVGNRELTATSVYQMREDLLEYIYDYFRLSDADKQWWNEKEALIEKPFVWQANFGVYSMKSVFGAAMNLFCMIAAVCLAGVYAGEKGFRTDSFVLSTREGKRSLWLVKFIAGEIFALAAGTLLIIAGMVPHLLFNGLHGINAPWQLIVPLCAYPYTAGQMLARYILTYYLGCFVIGALVMLFSVLFMNSMAAAGMICLGLVLDLFLALPPHLGLLSQLRYLTPAQVLINSSMANIWPGTDAVAECGAGILDINGRRGSRSAKLIQTTGSAIDSNIAARLPKPQFTATITVRKQGAASAAPDWRKQCLQQESKVIENWSSQKN